jgi:hypothetical protein
MASVGTHSVRPFSGPVNRVNNAVDANEVRGNDDAIRRAYVAHDADASIHIQSGTLANRPASLAEGSTYFATDTQDTYTYSGGVWVQSGWAHWYGDVLDTTDQPAAAASTPQIVTFNTTGLLRGVSLVSGSRITVAYAGDYNCEFSAQLANTDSSEHDVFFWWKKNGTTNVSNSAGRVTIIKKHGGGDGHLVVGWNVMLPLAANDYVELYWEATSTSVSLETIPATANIPLIPSVIHAINRI